MLFGCALLVAASCYSKPDDEPVSCEEKPDAHCGHPIDRVIVPKLRAVKLAPRDGDASQVCRRLSIDLIGRIPTLAELEACRAQTLEQRVDAFMARPEYVATMQRGWAETFGFDANVMWYGYAIDLDALAGRLAKKEIDYASFAAEAVVHPGFYALHQGDDWAFNVIEVFLGRSGRMDEVAGMRPLTRVFESRVFCDALIWSDAYSYAVGEGQSAAEAKTFADDSCVGSGSEEYVYTFCGCMAGEGSIGCRSTTLGPLIDFGSEGCRNTENPDSAGNLFRAGDQVPGLRNVCSGASRPECVDRLVDDTENIAGPLAAVGALDAPLRARLLSVGAALATREDFWEAAADRELKRFIGWWKDGIRRPDFDLPQVRTLLARELHKTGDLRWVQKLILTSLLYAGDAAPPSRVPVGPEAPLWSMGSTKILAAESWLDSAALAGSSLTSPCVADRPVSRPRPPWCPSRSS
jgi:hypothetical protein